MTLDQSFAALNAAEKRGFNWCCYSSHCQDPTAEDRIYVCTLWSKKSERVPFTAPTVAAVLDKAVAWVETR